MDRGHRPYIKLQRAGVYSRWPCVGHNSSAGMYSWWPCVGHHSAEPICVPYWLELPFPMCTVPVWNPYRAEVVQENYRYLTYRNAMVTSIGATYDMHKFKAWRVGERERGQQYQIGAKVVVERSSCIIFEMLALESCRICQMPHCRCARNRRVTSRGL